MFSDVYLVKRFAWDFLRTCGRSRERGRERVCVGERVGDRIGAREEE
jgi:hypothetical protein